MFLTLKNCEQHFVDTLSSVTQKANLINIFNPCYLETSKMVYVAFRAIQKFNPSQSIDGYLLEYSKNEESFRLRNLSEIGRQFSIYKVSDPKLSKLNGALWITFNTGWQKINNKLYLWNISCLDKPPLECMYADRQRIEKNWAYFVLNGKIKVLYAVDRFSIHNVDFSDQFATLSDELDCSRKTNLKLKNYSIGSQIVNINRWYYLILHKKLFFGQKRLYLGRLARFSISGEKFQFQLANKFIFHSVQSLFGARNKPNGNLISCSYFSGLTIDKEEFIISYGINDIDFNIVRTSQAIHWK